MKKTIISSLLTVAALAPIASFASDGTINFTGSVTSQTCTINSGSSSTFTVSLPKVSASSLATAGAKAGQTAFTIALSNCSPASGNARAFFEAGTNVDPVSGRLNIATGAGNATNVQIGLATTAGADIKIGASSGSQNTNSVAISGGSANLSYLAQYVATGAATAGATTSSVTYTIEFQ
ncbi:fimbrial protein [Herbaspirillum rhizosphaerae]|uniref:Fimbrial protein n=1 Tax=Herbaspirillum rhizosphaerae TaxID=346179 RepID=A0ABW8ZCN0_9BURK